MNHSTLYICLGFLFCWTTRVQAQVTITADKAQLCLYAVDNLVTFTANRPACSTAEKFTWYVNSVPVLEDTIPVFTTTLPTNAAVHCTYTCEGGTSDESSNTVQVEVFDDWLDAGQNLWTIQGQAVDIVADYNTGGVFSWTPADYLSSTSTPEVTSTPLQNVSYTVQLTTTNGCVLYDTISVVLIEEITPPNAFTPNGDGYNDTWEIGFIHLFPKAEINVYSRWGQLVYRTLGYPRSWDGTSNGSPLPAGTYYYVINLGTSENLEDNLFKGSVTIIY